VFLHKILDISPLIAVIQFLHIVVRIGGADPKDPIAVLLQALDVDLAVGVFVQLFKGLGDAGGGGSPQLIRPEMGGIKRFVKRFDIRDLKSCDLIVGEDDKDKVELELERKSYQDLWCPAAGAGAEISDLSQLCV
jgi:hypothetical protein